LILLERLVGASACVLAMFGLAVLRPDLDSKLAVAALALLGLRGLAATLLAAHPRVQAFRSERARVVQHVLDFTLIVLVLATTAGAASHFFTYLLYPVLAGALRWGVAGAFWTALAALAVYGGFVLMAVLVPPPDPMLRHYGIRILNLAVAAMLLGAVASPLRSPSGDLGREEASLAMILDALADGAVLVDERGFVRSANAAASRMFRAEPSEILGMAVRRLAPGLDLATAWMPAQPETEDGGYPTPARELTGIRLDGTAFPLNLTTGSIRLGGRRIHVGVVRDLSRRKEAEAESLRQRAQEIAEEERLRLVQDLHDGLLQTITAAALQLKTVQTLMERDVAQAEVHLGNVRDALAAEQRELRFWASEVKPSLSALARGPLEDQLLSTLERVQSTWGVGTDLRFSVDKGVPRSLHHPIYHMVQEGVVNAARHGEASRITVEVTERAQMVVIRVADDGKGFPFLGRYDQRQLSELRLGPVLLKHRVAAANGTLSIESTDTGSCLEIQLPRGGLV